MSTLVKALIGLAALAFVLAVVTHFMGPVAQTQPEDSTIGRSLKRPTDYADPDPPASVLISSAAFTPPREPLLVEGSGS